MPDRRQLIAGAGGFFLAGGVGLPASLAQAAGSRLDRTRFDPTFVENFETFDRFNGKTGRWTTNYGRKDADVLENRTLPSNGEKQLYVDSDYRGSSGNTPLGLNPFVLKNGILTIEAREAPEELRSRLWNYRFTSGIITTRFTFAQLYGHFEMRAKLPRGKGLWPAFWLGAQDGTWPPELDVVEMLGRLPTSVFISTHTRTDGKPAGKTQEVKLPDVTTSFHTYAASWSAEEVVWYFDDQEIGRQATPKDMHKPMYILANLGLGGRWAQDPDDLSIFPARMEIDYIRVYKVRT